jgi:hypothetical protein
VFALCSQVVKAKLEVSPVILVEMDVTDGAFEAYWPYQRLDLQQSAHTRRSTYSMRATPVGCIDPQWQRQNDVVNLALAQISQLDVMPNIPGMCRSEREQQILSYFHPDRARGTEWERAPVALYIKDDNEDLNSYPPVPRILPEPQSPTMGDWEEQKADPTYDPHAPIRYRRTGLVPAKFPLREREQQALEERKEVLRLRNPDLPESRRMKWKADEIADIRMQGVVTPVTRWNREANWMSCLKRAFPHPSNTQLICHYPDSLTSILDDHGTGWVGGMTPYFYDKATGNWFGKHQEGMHADFVNVCHQGCTIWYYVEGQHEDRLLDYLHEHILAPQLNWPDEWRRRGGANVDLAKSFLFSKALFVHPASIAAAGIPVVRLEQGQNMAVIGQGTAIHWGVSGDQRSLNEAVNYLPESWLKVGLRKTASSTVNHILLIITAWAAHKANGRPDVVDPGRAPDDWIMNRLFSESTAGMVHCSWILESVVKRFIPDLQRGIAYMQATEEEKNDEEADFPEPIFPYSLTLVELKRALADCKRLVAFSNNLLVKAWYDWVHWDIQPPQAVLSTSLILPS